MSRHFLFPSSRRTAPCTWSARRLVQALFVAWWLILPGASAGAQGGSDIVLVVDISTSMRTLFAEVRERVWLEIDQAHVGDRVVLVSFGESAHLLARRRVRGPADRAYLRAIAEELIPSARATYVTQGLERSYTELVDLFQDSPDRERRMLWLSDNINNPPDILGKDVLTLADLRTRHLDTAPQGEWFEFTAPLDVGLSKEISDFMQWAGRSFFRVLLRESQVALGTHPGPGMVTETTVHFAPQVPVLTGHEFLVIARVVDAAAGVPIDVAVEPSIIVVRDAPWAQTLTLNFDGPAGVYTGYLVFESLERENFLVEPDRVPLTFTVEALTLPDLEEEPTDKIRFSDVIDELLPDGGDVSGIGDSLRPVEFDDLAPGQSYTRRLTLTADRSLRPQDVHADTVISLPEGWLLTSRVEGMGPRLTVELHLRIPRGRQLPESVSLGSTFRGQVRFRTDDPGVQLQPAARQVMVTVWRVKPGPTFLEIAAATVAQDARRVLRWLRSVYTLYVLLALGAIIGLRRLVRALRGRTQQTAFFGEFIIVKNPGRGTRRNIKLDAVASMRRNETLVIGSAPHSDIRLRHSSVQDVHARITTRAVGGRLRVVLHPARGAEVRVDDIVRTEECTLEDKDLIALGDFLFLYSAPQPQRHVIVHFMDGSILRGTPGEWNIADPAFTLLLDDPEHRGDVARVEFSQLKAVYLLQAKGESTNGDGPLPEAFRADREIDVEFHDGEELRGRALKDYTDQAERFYVVPDHMPDLAAVLVERTNAKLVRVVSGPRKSASHTGRKEFLRR